MTETLNNLVQMDDTMFLNYRPYLIGTSGAGSR